jgi:hypothetical protein
MARYARLVVAGAHDRPTISIREDNATLDGRSTQQVSGSGRERAGRNVGRYRSTSRRARIQGAAWSMLGLVRALEPPRRARVTRAGHGVAIPDALE